MGLGQFIKKQFIDVIQWVDPDPEVLMWRFPVADQEIQNGASLTVREAQAALFVNEGVAADAFEPGRYRLTTATLPVLTNLKNWTKLFQSPFKSDVYFFNTRQQLGTRWGTAQPITVRDAEFGMVAVRAFGMYSYRIVDPIVFFREVAGVADEYFSRDLEEQLRNISVKELATLFGNQNIPFIDMAASQNALSGLMQETLSEQFAALGLQLDLFTVESITLPEELQEKMNERISMGIVGNLGQYTQYQVAQSIPIAAGNEGGLAGIGAGLGAGMTVGQVMSQSMGQSMAEMNACQGAMAAGAAMGASMLQSTEQLSQLKVLLDQGLITQDDYDETKAAVLKKLIG